MSRRGQIAWVGSVATFAIALLIGGFCLIGALEILDGLASGVLNNRKGPDVYLIERPVIFWTLIVFYATAVVVSAGMAVLLSSIALRNLFELCR